MAYEATWQRGGTNLDEDPHKGRDRHLPSLSFRDQAFFISSPGNLRMANKLLNGSMALQELWQALFQIAPKGPGFYRKLRCKLDVSAHSTERFYRLATPPARSVLLQGNAAKAAQRRLAFGDGELMDKRLQYTPAAEFIASRLQSLALLGRCHSFVRDYPNDVPQHFPVTLIIMGLADVRECTARKRVGFVTKGI
jgi:hypothetical protein